MIESIRQLGLPLQLLLISATALVVAWLLGELLDRFLAARKAAQPGAESPVATTLRHCSKPVALLVPLIVVYILLPWDAFAMDPTGPRAIMKIAMILVVSWLAARALLAMDEIVSRRLGVDRTDNLKARSLQTQLRVLRRFGVAVVFITGLISVLMSIDGLREFGAGLLASAGIASIVVGLAAQRTLANLLAGFQVGFTQPIRLDDVLVVEGEWGRVEEITLTYVVVAIWDQRRLILPIAYFLEKPFQNWTRSTAELLGTVYIYADFTLDVAAVRKELERIASESAYFDGRVCVLQVTDATERTMELRALISAANSGAAWDLRCEVREKLLTYLREQHAGALPMVRAELPRGSGRA